MSWGSFVAGVTVGVAACVITLVVTAVMSWQDK